MRLYLFSLLSFTFLVATHSLAQACSVPSPQYRNVNGAINFGGTLSIPEADAPTFSTFLTSFCYQGGACCNAFYARDKSHVFYQGKILAGADPSSLIVSPMGNYAKDTTHVWWRGQLIENSVAESFVWMKNLSNIDFAKDSAHVYMNGEVFAVADPASFDFMSSQLCLGSFTKDKNHVYKNSEIFVGADAKSFHCDSLVELDDQHAYYKDKVFPASTYRSEGPTKILGSSVYYYSLLIDGADAATYHYLGYGYGRDKHSLYNGTTMITGLDRSSFRPINLCFVADKEGIYSRDLQGNEGNFTFLSQLNARALQTIDPKTDPDLYAACSASPPFNISGDKTCCLKDETTLFALVTASFKSPRKLISVPLTNVRAEAHTPDFSGTIGFLRFDDKVYYGLMLDNPSESGQLPQHPSDPPRHPVSDGNWVQVKESPVLMSPATLNSAPK